MGCFNSCITDCFFKINKRQKNFFIHGKDTKECEENLINKLNKLYPKNKNEINKGDVLIDGNKKYNIDIYKNIDNESICMDVQYINYDNY